MNDNQELNPQNNDAIIVNQENEYNIILPCDVNDFGNFVSSLLGKPEVLKGEVTGKFDISYQEIANIYHLVNQRIQKQNEGVLLHFSITVYYDNGTSVTHNDIEKFKQYHPTEKSHPFEVVISFIYLINFPQISSPEKQTIDISLATESSLRDGSRRRVRDGGSFAYKVEYTDRTWATDISGLLKSHGKSLLDEHSKFSQFISENIDDVITYTGILVMLLSLNYWVADGLEYFDSLTKSEITPTELILSIQKYLLVSGSAIAGLWLIIYGIRRFSLHHLYLYRKSYIILVEADKKHKSKSQKQILFRWFTAITTLLLNVVAGLIAHYIIVSY